VKTIVHEVTVENAVQKARTDHEPWILSVRTMCVGRWKTERRSIFSKKDDPYRRSARDLGEEKDVFCQDLVHVRRRY